jgi:hypothetical protein
MIELALIEPEAALNPGAVATIDPQELAATSPVLSDDFEHEARRAEVTGTFRNQVTARLRGIRLRLIGRLLTLCKFAVGRVMKPDALVSAAYIAMSVTRATLPPNTAETFTTVMYLAIAVIHLVAPHFPKDESR